MKPNWKIEAKHLKINLQNQITLLHTKPLLNNFSGHNRKKRKGGKERDSKRDWAREEQIASEN